MNFRAYIERNGIALSRSHPELIHLAARIDMSAYTLYMVALGHKQLGLRKAIALVEETGYVVSGASVCDDFPSLRPGRHRAA